MYYCKSRYYVPDWCRWLNGDSVSCLTPQNINGLNLFSYCYNNPVMYFDPNGNMPNWLKVLIGVTVIGLAFATAGAAVGVGALIGAGLGVASGITLDENEWRHFVEYL